MRRKSLALLLVLLLPAVSAFGSFPVDHSRSTGELSTEFTLGLLNPGNTTATVGLSAEESPGYNVTFPQREFTVEPLEVSESPSGSGWYHLGGGRYTEVRYVDFRVEASRKRNSNRLQVPVTVRAAATGEGSSGTSSQVVYLRQHTFELLLDRGEPWKSEESEDSGSVDWIQIEGSEKVDSKDAERRNDSGTEKNYKQAAQTGNTGGSGVDSTTIVLLAAVIAMAIYTYRVA